MSVRLSGLSSGLDTEAIIKELMSAQSMKKTKIENKLTKLEWKEDKWKELNQKIYDLYVGDIYKLKTQSTYLTKTVTASDSSKATFTASSKVPTGTHTLSISQVASSQFVTGNKVSATASDDSSVEVNSGTKITDVKFSNVVSSEKTIEGYIAAGTVLNLKGGDGETQHYTISADTTVSDLTSWFKSNDISFSYDTTNGRFFLSSSQSGEANAFTLTSTTDIEAVFKHNTGYNYASTNLDVSDLETAISNYQSGINKDDAEGTITKYAQANYTAEKEVYMKYINDKWNDIIKDNTDFSLEWDDEGNWNLTKVNEDSELSLATYRQKLNEAKSSYDFDALMTGENKDTYVAIYTESYKSVLENGTSVSGKIDPTNYDMTNTFAALASGNNALDLLGIGMNNLNSSLKDADSGATVVKASDMVCTFNGCEYTSASNTLAINGLTINAIDKTDTDIKISVTNDTQGVYDSIKNFVKAYNEVLQSMNELYYADSARNYDVLSDEEREAMTDEQIEKWENKIKDSLLRRDTTLNSVLSAMRTITSTTVKVNNVEYSLSSFGICTGVYTEKGLLHINGDADDSTVADQTDKLMAALEQDPDTVMEVFTQIGSNLYSTLSEKMASTKLSSALTFYNDKEITSLKKEYQDEIDKWEEKLSDMEDRYYSQFSAMETALSKLNSQTSYFSSLFSN